MGNIEPKEAVKGLADVVVTDGFTGNIHIKTAEAVASFLKHMVKRDVLGPPLSKVGLALMVPGLIWRCPVCFCCGQGFDVWPGASITPRLAELSF